jgi:hypothetical protein
MTRILGSNPITNASWDEQNFLTPKEPTSQDSLLDKPTFGEEFASNLNKFGSVQGKMSQESTVNFNCTDSKRESGKLEKAGERNLQGKLQQMYLQKSFAK